MNELTDWESRAEPDELAILRGPCSGEPCWWNPQTGNTEYCRAHEPVIADIAMRLHGARLSKIP